MLQQRVITPLAALHHLSKGCSVCARSSPLTIPLTCAHVPHPSQTALHGKHQATSQYPHMTHIPSASAVGQNHIPATASETLTTEVLKVNPDSFIFADSEQVQPSTEYHNLPPISRPASLLTGPCPRLPAPAILPFRLNPTIATAQTDFDHLVQAATMLAQGGLVAVPTETVYGLAANALDPEAVSSIFQAKGRPSDNPLIVHVGSMHQAAQLLQRVDEQHADHWRHLQGAAGIPKAYADMLAQHWPGPLTILCPKPPAIPVQVTAGQPSVAVRLPSHPVVRALALLCSFPLAAPSANRSSRPSPTLAQHVLDDLKGRVLLVLDSGPCSKGIESTVVDGIRSDGLKVVLRPGSVTAESIRKLPGWGETRVWKVNYQDEGLEACPTTPGMKYRHYTPNATVILVVQANSHSAPTRMEGPGARPSAAQEPNAHPSRAPRSGISRVTNANPNASSAQNTVSRNDAVLRPVVNGYVEETVVGQDATFEAVLEQVRHVTEQQPDVKVGILAAGGHRTEQYQSWVAQQQDTHGSCGTVVVRNLFQGAGFVASTCNTHGEEYRIAGDELASGPARPGGQHATDRGHHIVAGVCTGSFAGQQRVNGSTLQVAAGEAAAAASSRGTASPEDAAAAAAGRNLFGDLRLLEQCGCSVIVVEGVPEHGEGLAVMNRLRKAASEVVLVGH